MTAKEYLNNIGRMKRMIAAKKEKILALEELATSTSQVITGMPHNPSGSKSKVEDAICKKLDLEQEISVLEAERNEAIEYLNSLPDTEETMILIDEVGLMPFGLLMDLWECHKQYNGLAKPLIERFIDDIIPDGI